LCPIAPLCREEQQPAEVRESGSEASKKQEAKPRSLLSFSKPGFGGKGPQPEQHHTTSPQSSDRLVSGLRQRTLRGRSGSGLCHGV